MSPDPGIPRRLHFVWVGGEMPSHLSAYVEGWRNLHEDYAVTVWSEDDLGWLWNRDLFAGADRLAGDRAGQLRSDIARYEILHRHGGIYLDADIEPRRRLDPLLGHECFLARESEAFLNNAVIGAVPEHPFIFRAITGLPDSILDAPRPVRPNVHSGPQYLTRLYEQDPSGVTALGRGTFYPYLWNQLERGREDFPDAYGIHHWNRKRGGAPVAQ